MIKLAHDQPESSTHHQAGVKWKELVKSRSEGKIKVQIFPSSMLGSGVQMVEQLQAGAIEAASLPTAWVAPLAPSLQVLDLPFLFPNRAAAYAVLDGPTGAAILEPLQKVNIVGVGFWESGFKQFTGNFRIHQPSDYQGHKIRTMPAPVIQEQFKAFGAVPTTISFGELYSALQQKVVDGQENPIVTIAAMRFFEVQKHMTLSDHGFIAYVFMLNKSFLDKLPKEQREILLSRGPGIDLVPTRYHQKVRGGQSRDVQEVGYGDHHPHARTARRVRKGGEASLRLVRGKVRNRDARTRPAGGQGAREIGEGPLLWERFMARRSP